MKLYIEYIKEREGLEIVLDEHCFLTYKEDGDDIIVYDIFSDKEVRGTGHMLEFCDKFYDSMRKSGKKTAYGMTDTRTKGWKNSERLLLKYGFEYIGLNPRDANIKHYCYNLSDRIGEK